MLIVGLCGYYASAAADRFSIEIGIVRIDAGGYEGTGDPAYRSTGGATSDGSCRRCDEPARGNNGAHTRNRQHTQAGKNAGSATSNTTDRGACPGTGTGIRGRYRFTAPVDIVRDKADIPGGDTAGFEIANRSHRIVEPIEYASDCPCGHDQAFL
jgi:hypothetical protein